MTFILFSLSVSAAFFVSSLVLLNYGRYLGLRYLRQDHSANLGGLTTIEGAVFALVGLLVAFTVSGALHRFDERRQLVIQEANAISTAYDRQQQRLAIVPVRHRRNRPEGHDVFPKAFTASRQPVHRWPRRKAWRPKSSSTRYGPRAATTTTSLSKPRRCSRPKRETPPRADVNQCFVASASIKCWNRDIGASVVSRAQENRSLPPVCAPDVNSGSS